MFSAFTSELVLLLVSAIWGLAFVAQRHGMESLGPMAYTGLRFAMASVVLLPVWLWSRKRFPQPERPWSRPRKAGAAALAGLVLFLATGLQQMGLVSTTASKAGFITGLYVLLVPMAGFFTGHRPGLRVWLGAGLASAGMYLLNLGSGGFAPSTGDFLVLGCTLFCAIHILLINHLTHRMAVFEIALGQSITSAVLGLGAALLTEPAPFEGTVAAALPLLYGSIMSIVIAFTLQIVAQRNAHPARASVIMSLEGLFAALGGVLILGEVLTPELAIGGGLMLVAVILGQSAPGRTKAG